MRRVVLLLCLLLPLAACGSDSDALGQPTPSSTECYYAVGGPSPTGPSTLAECLALSQSAVPGISPTGVVVLSVCEGVRPARGMPATYGPEDCATGAPTPAPPPVSVPEPTREPTDTLASASDLLSWSGGEVTLVKGLSPAAALAMLVPGQRPRPMREVCDAYGEPSAAPAPPAEPTPTGTAAPYDVVRCLTARKVDGWTVVVGLNDLTVGLGPKDLLARLSEDGREVVHVADHFEADAPFVLARDGREVRRFDFCSETSADEGAPLPQEAGLGADSCAFEPFALVQRLTGVKVTQDLLRSGDRLAVLTSS